MTNTDNIPFLDLIALHSELEEELVGVFKGALRTGAFIGGPAVEKFEKDFAAFCDTKHCIGVSSGTDALRFALMAAGIGEGDIVITVPNSFIATTEAISQSGARPVFVDVDAATYNMDARRLLAHLEGNYYRDDNSGCWRDRKLGLRVAGVIPVHLYGQPADMDAIQQIADRFHLTVIEDACQAHGAEYYSNRDGRWKKAGSMGKAAAFSFYPGKNLGACGEGGAVTTNDAELAQKIRMLRDHGQAKKYFHDVEGYNGRLDAIQAGILKVKLDHLTAWNQQRRESAREYRELLSSVDSGVGLPYEPSWAKAVYHLFVVRVANRAGLQRHLGEEHIGTGIHYPVPLHLQKAYAGLGYEPGDFPVAEQAAEEILSLPMYPGLKAEQQRRIVKCIHEFARLTHSEARVMAVST
jgi:dTDP-4-amino-4,6-dideoxygalactose transaminase